MVPSLFLQDRTSVTPAPVTPVLNHLFLSTPSLRAYSELSLNHITLRASISNIKPAPLVVVFQAGLLFFSLESAYLLQKLF